LSEEERVGFRVEVWSAEAKASGFMRVSTCKHLLDTRAIWTPHDTLKLVVVTERHLRKSGVASGIQVLGTFHIACLLGSQQGDRQKQAHRLQHKELVGASRQPAQPERPARQCACGVRRAQKAILHLV